MPSPGTSPVVLKLTTKGHCDSKGIYYLAERDNLIICSNDRIYAVEEVSLFISAINPSRTTMAPVRCTADLKYICAGRPWKTRQKNQNDLRYG